MARMWGFLILVAWSAVAAANPRWNYVSKGNCSINSRHVSGKDRIRLSSLSKCQALCSERNDCTGVNFRPPRQKRCQLYSTTVGVKALNFIPKVGWLYKEKSHNGPSASCSNMVYKNCNPYIENFSQLEYLFNLGSWHSFGSRDTKLNNDKWYYMPSYSNERNLYVYPTLTDAKANSNYEIIRLATGCFGSQYIIYDGLLFCRKYNNRHILVYSTINGTLVHDIGDLDSVPMGGTNVYAGYSNHCHYRHGHYSDIDMMVDESGIYALWGRHNDQCRVTISRLNMDTLASFEKHYHLDMYKLYIGNAFMRCGRVFMTNQYNSDPTPMRHIWDMRTGNLTSMPSHEYYKRDLLYMENWSEYMSPLTYNPQDGYIYRINNPQWHRHRYNLNPEGETDIWRLI